MLILAKTAEVAAWARQLLGDHPDERVQFIVLGPDDIPRITDPITARADPSLAVLSAAMHADGPNGAAVMRAAAAALTSLPRVQALKYSRIVFHNVSEQATRTILKDLMQTQQTPKEEYGAGWLAFVRSLKAEGAASARSHEKQKSRAAVLLRLLSQRGFDVDPASRKRILACRSVKQLDGWLDRVLTIHRAADLFK